MKRNQKYTQEEITIAIDMWKESGLTKAEFCKRESISLRYKKMELLYLPAYSPDLNPIERAWWYIRKKITHNRYLVNLEERKIKFWLMFSHYQKPNMELLRVCNVNY